MCGIAGFSNFHLQEGSEAELEAIGQAIYHRGPDAGVRDREGERPGRVRGRRSGFQGPAPRGGVLPQVWRPAHAKDGAAAAGEPAERVPPGRIRARRRRRDVRRGWARRRGAGQLEGSKEDVQHGGTGRRRRRGHRGG